MRFAVGVNYAPRAGAAALWHDFDPGTIQTDLAGIAAAGIDSVRFLVPWDETQSVLERLEALIGLIAEAGLRCIPALTCSGGIGNIYSGALLERQVAFARDAGSRLHAHPAIVAWDVGHAFTNGNPPPGGRVYCTQVLELLQQDGRLGAYWFQWPGNDSPVTAVLGAFAREMRETVKARDMPMISSTYYYRTLPTSTQTLYDAFLSFIAERRAEVSELK